MFHALILCVQVTKDLTLTNHVPQLKKTLEMLLYKVKVCLLECSCHRHTDYRHSATLTAVELLLTEMHYCMLYSHSGTADESQLC